MLYAVILLCNFCFKALKLVKKNVPVYDLVFSLIVGREVGDRVGGLEPLDLLLS